MAHLPTPPCLVDWLKTVHQLRCLCRLMADMVSTLAEESSTTLPPEHRQQLHACAVVYSDLATHLDRAHQDLCAWLEASSQEGA